MKYMLEAVLELPRNKVIELFTNPDNLPRWQPSLTSFEPLSGTPGQKGAKLRLKHKMGGRIIEMTETIETESLPEEVTYSYEAKGAWNRAVNRFLEHSPNQTKWVFETEFRCNGILRILAFFMPSMFRNQSLKDIRRFKEFAESQVRNTCL